MKGMSIRELARRLEALTGRSWESWRSQLSRWLNNKVGISDENCFLLEQAMKLPEGTILRSASASASARLLSEHLDRLEKRLNVFERRLGDLERRLGD